MNKILLTILIISIGAIVSCSDIVEPDISGKSVILLAPYNGLVTGTLTQTFWWEEVEGAEQYNLQIVKSSFTAITQLVLDTMVSSDKFTISLPSPGPYQWRVKGINNGGETLYSTWSFSIDSTLDLGSQIISLLAPIDNIVTSSSSITFKWNLLYNADQYRFQLLDFATQSLLFDTVLVGSLLNYSIYEGEYSWQVRAENSTSVSPYTLRNLSIDQTGPSASSPTLPAYGDTTNTPVALSWTRDPSTVGDSLFIYSDSTLINISFLSFNVDTFFSFNANTFTNYFWRLKSIDAAGNQSGFSTTYRFYVQ